MDPHWDLVDPRHRTPTSEEEKGSWLILSATFSIFESRRITFASTSELLGRHEVEYCTEASSARNRSIMRREEFAADFNASKRSQAIWCGIADTRRREERKRKIYRVSLQSRKRARPDFWWKDRWKMSNKKRLFIQLKFYALTKLLRIV